MCPFLLREKSKKWKRSEQIFQSQNLEQEGALNKWPQDEEIEVLLVAHFLTLLQTELKIMCQGEKWSYLHLLELELVQSSGPRPWVIVLPHSAVDIWQHLDIFFGFAGGGRGD